MLRWLFYFSLAANGPFDRKPDVSGHGVQSTVKQFDDLGVYFFVGC